MGRVWVLDTETKGTGAQMVPLDTVQQKPAPEPEDPALVTRTPKPPAPKPAPPRTPRAFKVVDVMSRRVLADGVGARATLDVLGAVRSIVDVSVSVREPGSDRGRLLTLAEQRALWDRRTS